jgi:probable phosphoglycerate mutase
MSRSGRSPGPPDPPESSPNIPARLVFARHAESTWNGMGKIQGQLDPPLSERGREQALRLAERLGSRRWTGFYTSDLKRARETAQPIADRLEAAPVALAELREIYLGEWEGLTRDDLARGYPELWQRWLQKPDWDLVPGGEGAGPFAARVAAVLDRILAAHPAGDILVVTHGGVIQVALGRVVGRPSAGIFPFRIGNASITTIEHGSRGTTVSGVNDVCHLEQPTGSGAGATALSL